METVCLLTWNCRHLANAHVVKRLHKEAERRGWGRRAPKVTVTREGASLCQKECYPVAFVLVNCSSL